TGDPRLVGYIVPADGQTIETGELKDYLHPVLPEYMIPAHYVFLRELPLTPNGKVDRKALPLPEPIATRTTEAAQPRDEVETQLVHIWESLLKTTPIGVTDDFFALGGHSILAVRLFAEIEKCFARTIPLSALLKAPTIAQLAKVIRRN